MSGDGAQIGMLYMFVCLFLHVYIHTMIDV